MIQRALQQLLHQRPGIVDERLELLPEDFVQLGEQGGSIRCGHADFRVRVASKGPGQGCVVRRVVRRRFFSRRRR